MKIGIDIDDTICNTKVLQIDCWKEYFNNNKCDRFTEELPSNINSFGDPYIDLFWDTYRETFFSPELKSNVSEVINRLQSKGVECYIITSRITEKYDNLVERLDNWLKSNNINMDGIYTGIKDKAKFLVDNNIDVLIDDDIRHYNKVSEVGKIGIHFNEDMTWEKVEEIINNYL